MNLQFYLEKLFNSEEFKSFMKENKEAYFCSGFFVIDKDGNDNKQHIDYFVPSSGKTFSFQMEEEIKLIPLEQADVKIPEKIPESLDINLDYVEKLILGEMFERKIENKLQKIIYSIQRVEGKDFLVGTIFISMMGMINFKIDLAEMKIIDFEKKSFMDFLKRVK